MSFFAKVFTKIKPNLDTDYVAKLIGYGLSKNDLTDALYKKTNLTEIYKGRTILSFGDSITNGSTAPAGNFYTDKLTPLIGSALIARVIRKGFPGFRSDQLLSIFDNEVAINNPDIVTLLIGVNDAAQYKSVSEYVFNMSALIQKVRSIGAIPIVCTVPPALTTGNDNTRRNLIAQYNLWIRFYCAQNNIRLADVHTRLVNNGTGDAVTGWFADIVHPNIYGHQYIAEAISDAIQGLVPFYHPVNSVSVSNLVSNPLFLTSSATWSEQVGGTGNEIIYSQQPASGKIKNGFCWQLEWNQIGATSNGTRYFRTSVNFADKGLVTGDQVLITVLIDIEDMEGGYSFAATASNPVSYTQFRIMSASFQSIVTIAPNVVRSPGPVSYIYTITGSEGAGILLTLQTTLGIGRHVKIRIGEVGAFKITGLPEIFNMVKNEN